MNDFVSLRADFTTLHFSADLPELHETLQIPMPFRLSRFIGEHSDISELVEDADESAPVRLGNRTYRSPVYSEFKK